MVKVKTGLIWMLLTLGFFPGPAAVGQISAAGSPVHARSDTLRTSATQATPGPQYTKLLRTLAAPTLLIGYGLSVTGNHGFPSSKSVYRARQRLLPDFRTRIDDVTFLLPALAVYGLNLAGIEGAHAPGEQTVLLLLAGTVTNGVTLGLKEATRKLRPDRTNFKSFPSGHTANAFVAAEFLHQEYKHRSAWYSVAGYSVAAATGAMRVLNNRHWLSDVLAGAGIGMLSTRVVYLVYPRVYRKITGHAPDKVGVIPTYQQGCVGVFVVIRLD